jgi:hypothetical protein
VLTTHSPPWQWRLILRPDPDKGLAQPDSSRVLRAPGEASLRQALAHAIPERARLAFTDEVTLEIERTDAGHLQRLALTTHTHRRHLEAVVEVLGRALVQWLVVREPEPSGSIEPLVWHFEAPADAEGALSHTRFTCAAEGVDVSNAWAASVALHVLGTQGQTAASAA